MLKKLIPYVGEYKWNALLSPLTILGEVVLEVFIPFLMARIVDIGIPNQDYPYILKMGGLMVLMAMGALAFGALAARVAAVAANGAARNLRIALFSKVESFSFKNMDKFTTPSLITRMTSDVTNVQMSFMMCIRMLARAPFMLILATIMAIRISPDLSVVILCAIPFLGATMAIISRLTFPRFTAMLEKYDAMNASTQENLIAIRVVKAFVRGKHETEQFADSAAGLKKAQIGRKS